ncbi:MAG: DUF721 domain-containing protein [Chlamydiota bacterium]|jgi:hypothetical protein
MSNFQKKTTTTFIQVKDLLPKILNNINADCVNHPREIFAKWPEIIGEKFAKWTKPVSFQKGILKVKVTSAVLYSLLVQQEKKRILNQLKELFPKASIRDIFFHIG